VRVEPGSIVEIAASLAGRWREHALDVTAVLRLGPARGLLRTGHAKLDRAAVDAYGAPLTRDTLARARAGHAPKQPPIAQDVVAVATARHGQLAVAGTAGRAQLRAFGKVALAGTATGVVSVAQLDLAPWTQGQTAGTASVVAAFDLGTRLRATG